MSKLERKIAKFKSGDLIHRTTKEAAGFYCVTENTIRRWLYDGKLTSMKIGRDHRFIREAPKAAQ